jgi:Zn-dependent alcohol dehydrogenase
MGHEYCGIVEEIGAEVRSVKPGQFVIGSFFASDNTCPNCQAGYQTSCVQRSKRCFGRSAAARLTRPQPPQAARQKGLRWVLEFDKASVASFA